MKSSKSAKSTFVYFSVFIFKRLTLNLLVCNLFFLAMPFEALAGDVVFYGEPSLGVSYNQIRFALNSSSVADVVVKGPGVSGGMNIGWYADYVHLILGGGVDNIFYDSLLQGGQWNLGAGVGWEWNVPMMTTLFVRNIGFYGSNGDTLSNANFFSVGLGLSYFISESMKINLSYSTFSQTISSTDIKSDLYQMTISFPFVFNYPNEWWRTRLH
jgi:hypothetical protein